MTMASDQLGKPSGPAPSYLSTAISLICVTMQIMAQLFVDATFLPFTFRSRIVV